jgi:hypothetical protein
MATCWNTSHAWDLIAGSFTNPGTTFSTLSGTGGVYDAGTKHLVYAGIGYFAVDYSHVGSTQLDWVTAVPEPGSLLLGSLAAAALGSYRLRKRRSQVAASSSEIA